MCVFQFPGVLADVNRDLPSAVEEEYKCSRQTTERGTLVSLQKLLLKRCWHVIFGPLLSEQMFDGVKIPMLNSRVPVKVFDAFQRLQCLCLFTCLFESQLNCPPLKLSAVALSCHAFHFFFSNVEIDKIFSSSGGPDSVICSHLCRKIGTADEIWGQQLEAQAARIWKTSRYCWSETPGV